MYGETMLCGHCGGKGSNTDACCCRNAGVKHNPWSPLSVVCCVCGGSGVIACR